ncbi:MAG: hypothetical protein ACI8WM_000191 [Burkholderiaceae bacterium]|jgi:hypothetical protein
MRSETPASPQTCGTLIPCLTPAFGSCFNAVYVKGHVKINFNFNFNRNRNRNRNRNFSP